jgi:hypothetical protein
MTFEAWPEGYIPVKVAYERAVGTLTPEARPGDEYLMALDEDAAADAYATNAPSRGSQLRAPAELEVPQQAGRVPAGSPAGGLIK